MSFDQPGSMKRVLTSLVIAMAAMLAGCGGGGGGGEPASAGPNPPSAPAPTPPVPTLALMVDSLGREVPEADFGGGDGAAAGVDGVAIDGGPIVNGEVTLTDAAGNTRSARTDAAGYYRVSVTGLRAPFIVKVSRSGGWHWYSASKTAPRTRAFVTINLSGLTDKVLSYVADAAPSLGGIAANVPSAALAPGSNDLLSDAKQKLKTGLARPLAAAGLDPATYDPVTSPLQAAGSDKHALFLQRLVVTKDDAGRMRDQGRTVVVATLAGAGGVRLDGALGTATFSHPTGLSMDASGNLYVADTANNVIRRIDPAGVVTTVAGNGTANYTNAANATAAFNAPTGVAADAVTGNVYVADSGNHSIRTITPAGRVTTLAGSGSAGSADGTGTAARFSRPASLAVDTAGNVYVADTGNGAIRKVTPAGVVTTLAAEPLSEPTGVGVDRSGNVYAAYSRGGYGRRPIRKITPDGVESNFYAPTGDEGTFFNPWGVAVDAAGNVYVTDRSPNRVFRISPTGAGSVLAGRAFTFEDFSGVPGLFSSLRGIAVDAAGNALVADTGNNTIRKVTPSGDVSTFAGRSTGFSDGVGADATFAGPMAVAIGAAGDILVADTGNHAIRTISAAGAVTTLAGSGSAGYADGAGSAASFNAPTGLARDGSGSIYVADSKNEMIRKITGAGVVSTFTGRPGWPGVVDGPVGAASFSEPTHLALDRDGNLYVSEARAQALRKVTSDGTVSTVARGGWNIANGQVIAAGDFGPVASDPHGFIYFEAYCPGGPSAPSQPCVYAMAPAGWVSRVFSLLATHYWGLATDAGANLHFIQDLSTDLEARGGIFRLAGGAMTTVALDPRFTGFRGFVFDPNGNIVVADKVNSAIRLVLP